MDYFHSLPGVAYIFSWFSSLNKALLGFPRCPFDLVLLKSPIASFGFNRNRVQSIQWSGFLLSIVEILLTCNVNNVNVVKLMLTFVLEQMPYLGTAGFSCFRVSISVNCTACPPLLVLKTSPWRNFKRHTNSRIKKDTLANSRKLAHRAKTLQQAAAGRGQIIKFMQRNR